MTCPRCGAEIHTDNTAHVVFACGSIDYGQRQPFWESKECLRRQLAALQAIVDLAVEWRKAFWHGRDITDEGFSLPDPKAQNALYDAVEEYEASAASKSKGTQS